MTKPKPTPATAWDLIKTYWQRVTLIGAIAGALIALGVAKGEFGAMKADITELKALDVPVIKSKTEKLDAIAIDLNAVKVEQARQGAKFDAKLDDIGRRLDDRRAISAATQPTE